MFKFFREYVLIGSICCFLFSWWSSLLCSLWSLRLFTKIIKWGTLSVNYEMCLSVCLFGIGFMKSLPFSMFLKSTTSSSNSWPIIIIIRFCLCPNYELCFKSWDTWYHNFFFLLWFSYGTMERSRSMNLCCWHMA